MIEIMMEPLFTHHCPCSFQRRKRCGLQDWSWESWDQRWKLSWDVMAVSLCVWKHHFNYLPI